MPMKPRTFRRVVLLGSLGAIVLIVALGYFVVRPWQNHRQLEAMRKDGIAAYEQGEYLEAMRQLGRFKNNAEDFEPEIYLMLARAAEKYETNDGGNIPVSINAYRDYLRRVPGDLEAMRELLPLLNVNQQYREAQTLAQDLINTHGDTSIDVLRELRYSLMLEQADAQRVEPVARAIFEHEDSTYGDANMYLRFLRSQGRNEEADELLDHRIASNPDRLQEQLLDFQRRSASYGEEVEFQVVVDELAEIIGFDLGTMQWEGDAPSITSDEAWYVSLAFNILRRQDLSITVQLRAADELDDMLNGIWAARRLYWAGRNKELMDLEIRTAKDELDSDVLGYQYLSAKQSSDTEKQEAKREAINQVQLDRRGRAWQIYIDGLAALDANDTVAARVALEKAIKIYPSEPTFHLTMGDVHRAQGRFNEAVGEWILASEIVNGEVGIETRSSTNTWPTPMIRVVSAYANDDRLNEAVEYIDELERVAGNDLNAIYRMLSARADLARQGELAREAVLKFAEAWTRTRSALAPEVRAKFSMLVAEIFASARLSDIAREEIVFGIETMPGNRVLIAQLADVDTRYRLNALQVAGVNPDDVIDATPRQATRRAALVMDSTGSLDAALLIFDEAMARVEPEDPDEWTLARARFVDRVDRERAIEFWDELLEQRPDDIELVYLAIESNAYARNLTRIDSLIDHVTELTSTAGKALPSRLRLARANAMVSGELEKSKTNRDRAMEIVRAVVANEPMNTHARNMLGRLLSLQPSPGLPESERFEPDYKGAIEQYMILSRQLNGSGAQTYLLESFDLAYRMGDEAQARDLLREYISRFGRDVYNLPTVAERYENLGDIDRAAELYQQVYNGSGGLPEAGLSLADLRFRQGRSAQAKELLKEIGKNEVLSRDSVLRMASLYTRSGSAPEGEQVIRNAEQYGLSAIDAKMLLADYAELYMSPEAQIEALREATSIEPSHLPAWKRLVKRLVELGQFELAQQAYADAISVVDEDTELARYGAIAQGAPETANQMLSLPGMQDDPILRQVVERVEAYSNLDASTAVEDRYNMLSSMIDEFPSVDVLQSYCVKQMSILPLNPVLIASNAEKALKNAPSNTAIMGIAGETYLRVNMPEEALRVVNLWRANTLETNIVANAISARALIQFERYAQAEQELAPFVDESFRTPELKVSREVLDAFSLVRLRQGEDPSVTAQRLRPLIETNDELRNRTWLGLASREINDLAMAEEWIRTAEAYSTDADRFALANAWITLAFDHETWNPEYAQMAIAQVESMLEGDGPSVAFAYTLMARAQVIIARDLRESGSASDAYENAVSSYMRAAELDPTNLLPLIDAASYAAEGKLNERVVEIYDRILAMGLGDDGDIGRIKAMVLNNLAMSRVRIGVQSDDQQAVLALVEHATRIQPDVASYWGTRGWVELEFGLLEAAESSFRRSFTLNPNGAEGITGLFIVLYTQGETDTSETRRLKERLDALRSQGDLEEELRAKLDSFGL